jgi:uncharacterized protein
MNQATAAGAQCAGGRSASIHFTAGRSLSADRNSRALWDEGLALFNAGRFFECHEVWEELWKRAAGTERLFIQAMIQAAVAILHAERGNHSGACSVWAKAREKLSPMPAVYMGIALDEFRGAVEGFIAAAPRADLRSASPPRIRIATPSAPV